jgi:Acyl-CoA dehydrogenase, C-terminal domain
LRRRWAAATQALLRERPIAQTQFAQAEGLLQAARVYFYRSSDEIWRKGEARESFGLQDRAHAQLAVVTAAKLALQPKFPYMDPTPVQRGLERRRNQLAPSCAA